MTRPLAPVVVAFALLLAGCGEDESEDTTAEKPVVEEAVEEPEPSPEPREPPGVEVATGDSQFGRVLFGEDDQAVYLFEPEGVGKPRCYGSCAAAWPPVLSKGEPQASGKVRQGLLGTVERRDGSAQVTYDGQPLYTYADEGPGELRCHNIDHEGGLWLAVEPTGEPVPHDSAQTVFLD